MSVAVKGLDKFDATFKAWFGSVRKRSEDVAVGMAQQALRLVATYSPQYSGEFAANWKISYGSSGASFDSDPLGTKGEQPAPYQVGSPRAIAHAVHSSYANANKLTLGQTIYISNNTPGDNGNLASKLDSGRIALRVVNAEAFDMRARTVRLLGDKYRVIGKAQIKALGRIGA